MVHRVDASTRVWSVEAVRRFERREIRGIRLSELALMEHAGIGATAVARHLWRGRVRGEAAKAGEYALIVGGVGNNGGDALVVARGLSALGIPVRTAMVGPAERATPSVKTNRAWLDAAGVPVVDVAAGSVDALRRLLPGAGLVVDGLLGIRFRGEPRGEVGEAMALVRNAAEARLPVLALDLPSGLDGDSGAAARRVVRATATVTFGGVKAGLTRGDGPALSGELFLADIGIPFVSDQ